MSRLRESVRLRNVELRFGDDDGVSDVNFFWEMSGRGMRDVRSGYWNRLRREFEVNCTRVNNSRRIRDMICQHPLRSGRMCGHESMTPTLSGRRSPALEYLSTGIGTHVGVLVDSRHTSATPARFGAYFGNTHCDRDMYWDIC